MTINSYIFTDTAGIRRRGKIDRGVEGYSVLRSLRAIGSPTLPSSSWMDWKGSRNKTPRSPEPF